MNRFVSCKVSVHHIYLDFFLIALKSVNYKVRYNMVKK